MFFKKKRISNLSAVQNLEDIRQRSRILLVDDEKPNLVEHLQANHYSVDYQPDLRYDQAHLLTSKQYDLVILDFGGVGGTFGESEGLDILKFIKRCSPKTKVLTYTSKYLGSDMADFFRMADGVLEKDAGLRESLERIDEMLVSASSLDARWDSLLAKLGIAKNSDDDFILQDRFVRGVEHKGERAFTTALDKFNASDDAKIIAKTAFELGKIAFAIAASSHAG